MPATRKQEDAKKRTDAGLHVGHEEVQSLQGPNGFGRFGRSGLLLRHEEFSPIAA